MRTIICLLILLSMGISVFSQPDDPVTQKENCLKKLAQEKSTELGRLKDSYFEDNPNPSKYVFLACDSHYPKYWCAKHHKQCAGSCDCLADFTNQVNDIETSYKQKENGCEQFYKNEIAKIKPQMNDQNGLSKSGESLPKNNPGYTIENTTDANKKTIEKQQYQTQSNNYLNQAQNTNQSAISQQVNLELAKTNAYMAGNTQQVRQIEYMQGQNKNVDNQQLVNSIIKLSQITADISANKAAEDRHWQEMAEKGRMNRYRRVESEALNGNAYSMVAHGDNLWEEKNYDGAFYWWAKSSEVRNEEGMLRLFYVYKVISGPQYRPYWKTMGKYPVEKNDSISEFWLRQSAESGSLVAIKEVGDKYYHLNSCEDKLKALVYYLYLDSIDYKPKENGQDLDDKWEVMNNIGDIYSRYYAPQCLNREVEIRKENYKKALIFYNKEYQYWIKTEIKSNAKMTMKKIKKVEKNLSKL